MITNKSPILDLFYLLHRVLALQANPNPSYVIDLTPPGGLNCTLLTLAT